MIHIAFKYRNHTVNVITYLVRYGLISVFVFVQRPCFCITSNLAPRVGNAINWKVVMHVVQKILILIDIFKKGYN